MARTWWTAALVAAAATAAGCDGLGAATVTPPPRVHQPVAQASPTPPAAVPPSASPALGPAPTPTAPPQSVAGPQRCHTSQLVVSFAGSQGAAGHIFLTFRLANTTPVTCWVYGFVGMQMLDASSRPLPTRVLRNGGAFAGQPGPTLVDLPPAQAATFDVAWGDVPVGSETSCPEATQLIVTPPDEFDHVTIPVSGFSLAPCNQGELDVTPVHPPGAGPA